MRQVLFIICFVAGNFIVYAQEYSAFTRTLNLLYHNDAAEVERVWESILAQGVPFTHGDSVAFLYRGDAKRVSWLGDFNQWGYSKEGFKDGIRIPGTNIWILRATFPRDARLDYKIVVDDRTWLLDPNNPNRQWSGVGGGSPNSELRMPAWTPDTVTSARINGAAAGDVARDFLFHSTSLGYQVMYSIYLPADYDPAQTYPTVYVTDGHEYMHEHMGNMIVVLDNLIHLKKIRPVIAVFIDTREPINRANNRRMSELALNDKYLSFLADELVPQVATTYSVSNAAAERAIVGTSMGGLSAAYFAFKRPEVFGLAGIQSPAFWMRSEIYTVCDNPDNPPVKTFMTTGTIHDTREGAQKMKKILERNTCTYAYREVNQGHSWGNWRDLIDDILIYFFGD